MSLLEVRDLRVSFPTADGVVQAVRGVSFEVDAGGRSGSSASRDREDGLTQTLLGLTPGGDVAAGACLTGPT